MTREQRLIDANAFEERVRAAVGMVEGDLTEDFKDGVNSTLKLLETQETVFEVSENPTNGDMDDCVECVKCADTIIEADRSVE